MAGTPAFTATPLIATGNVVTANTARDGSGTIANIVTTSGACKIEEIVVKANGDPADSVVTIFIDITGAGTWVLFDEYDIGNPAAGSTTVAGYRLSTTYANLCLPAGAKLGAAITVAPTAGSLEVWALGGYF